MFIHPFFSNGMNFYKCVIEKHDRNAGLRRVAEISCTKILAMSRRLDGALHMMSLLERGFLEWSAVELGKGHSPKYTCRVAAINNLRTGSAGSSARVAGFVSILNLLPAGCREIGW